MTTRSFTCTQAKQIDLVDYLKDLGYTAQKVRGDDHWYLSPLRLEKTASFKVNRKLNVWFDHGAGIGGDVIDFGTHYFSCSVSEFLQKLSEQSIASNQQSPFFFHPHRSAGSSSVEAGEKNLEVVAANPLKDHRLCRYLKERKISPELAKKYVHQVSFNLHGKTHLALGLKNNSVGWELRNSYFKGSASPKDVLYIRNGEEKLSDLIVVEGMFDLLSYLHLEEIKNYQLTNLLVLNSLSFFEKSMSLMETHPHVHLYLDRDDAGRKMTLRALERDSRFADKSSLYEGYKDLNDYLIHHSSFHQRQTPKPRLRVKGRLWLR